jgi:hypothetical protein
MLGYRVRKSKAALLYYSGPVKLTVTFRTQQYESPTQLNIASFDLQKMVVPVLPTPLGIYLGFFTQLTRWLFDGSTGRLFAICLQ